ncbi:2Fe-2S iron-sulfur cluster-binding protein [Halodurantibacterium flavum]|uniref:2Fe-2S iron-sulfur cluster-binding protein n=1 Tax=Halodurantibacterium flavum TaxID=1382802 RepID=A0ABW4S752_9RHOB
MAISINGRNVPVPEDPRVSLADLLREGLHLTGTKVGCNQGACGACTVILDGERVLSCLTLAVQADGCRVTTIEGLGEGLGEGLAEGPAGDAAMHPMQEAFIEHDGFQCGYCTPGQICSAVAMLEEIERGIPSYVSGDLNSTAPLTAEEIRERMSGNLCRCGAHNGIVAAIVSVAESRVTQDRTARETVA